MRLQLSGPRPVAAAIQIHLSQGRPLRNRQSAQTALASDEPGKAASAPTAIATP
jgi:hypothetical protein